MGRIPPSIILLLVQLLPAWALSATITVGPGQTRTTIAAGLSAMNGGDTLVIKNGTYNETLEDVKNGGSGGYTIIRSENDGGAIISNGMAFSHTNSYIQVEGLKFIGTMPKTVEGNHLKFMRCAFEGGPVFGNGSSVTVGTNNSNDTAYVLFEDCWSYGAGGRYNWEIFNTDHIILRRCVARHDGGWTDDKGDPEAAVAVYNSSHVELQNVIAVDSDLSTYHMWGRAFYTIWNPASEGAGGVLHPTNNVNWTGSISLNNKQQCWESDGGPGMDIVSSYTDIVCWRPSGGGFAGGSSGGETIPTINRATFGGCTNVDFDQGFNKWDSGTMTVTNTIAVGFGSIDFGTVSASYNDTYDNGDNGSCANCQAYNPSTHGLLYLTRIEEGSSLKTAGSGGGQIGATIVKRLGVSGTLHGDTGYNTLTNEDLWPWPNEARIKSDLASVPGGLRGFTTGTSMNGSPQTLTNYIWEYLGNASPFASTATWWDVTVSVPGHGTLSCGSPVVDGSTTTCATVPSAGYSTSSISGCGGSWSSGNLYTTGAITADCTVTAQFAAAPAVYTVGGSVLGLSGTVVLRNNGGDSLSRNSNGSFTFATGIASGFTYSVTVYAQPFGQTCAVANGSGTISAANVTSVSVTCVSTASRAPAAPAALHVR